MVAPNHNLIPFKTKNLQIRRISNKSIKSEFRQVRDKNVICQNDWIEKFDFVCVAFWKIIQIITMSIRRQATL